MKNKKIRVVPGALHHIYQQSEDGGLIFYSVGDFLCYYTIFMTRARRHGIAVYGLSLMYDHTHSMVAPPDHLRLGRFIQEVNSNYTRTFNYEYGRTGALFRKGYGCAPRTDPKRARSSLIYLYNNQVEKHLCSKAMEDRWNFLAYLFSDNPFSEKLVVRRASYGMRKALSVVRSRYRKGQPLSPTLFRNLASGLSQKERSQLVDFIITTYSEVDKEKVIEMWGSAGKMLIAINSTTGSEFDIGEVVMRNSSDADFPVLIKTVQSDGIVVNPGEVTALDDSRKRDLALYLRRKTGISYRHICKFLHFSPDGDI